MEENIYNTAPKKEGIEVKDTYWIVGVLVLGFIAWQIWQMSTVTAPVESQGMVYEQPGTEFRGLPQGRIYMTLFAKDGSDLQPYVFDVARNQFNLASVDDLSVAFHQTFSGDHVAFVGTTREIFDNANGDADKALQIYSSAIGEGSAIAQVSRSARITQEPLLGKRALSLSDDGTKVLFVAYEGDNTKLPTTADEWGVYLADGSSVAQRIVNGMYPHWIDGTHFVYLKSDGVYIYNMDSEVESMVWGYATETQTNMMMHLSEDKSTLAWTLPGNGLVLILRIVSLEKPKMKQVAQISTHAFWPVVSPNGDFVAVQTVNWEALEEDPQPQIELYSIQEIDNPQKLGATLDLGAFDQQRMFVTDWRN